MFVVNRVELGAVDQVLDVWHLELCDPAILEQCRDAVNETVEVGDVRENVVADDNVGTGLQLLGEGDSKEFVECPDAALFGDAGNVGGRLDAEYRHARGPEILEQVAVVAGDFDDETFGA